jgi:hypothetical protein
MSIAAAQTEAPKTTAGLPNGRLWLAMSKDWRSGYIGGYVNGVQKMTKLGNVAPQNGEGILFPYYVSFGGMADFLDEFYAEPLNRRISIPDALQVAVFKSHGTSEEALEQWIAMLRRASAGAGQ